MHRNGVLLSQEQIERSAEKAPRDLVLVQGRRFHKDAHCGIVRILHAMNVADFLRSAQVIDRRRLTVSLNVDAGLTITRVIQLRQTGQGWPRPPSRLGSSVVILCSGLRRHHELAGRHSAIVGSHMYFPGAAECRAPGREAIDRHALHAPPQHRGERRPIGAGGSGRRGGNLGVDRAGAPSESDQSRHLAGCATGWPGSPAPQVPSHRPGAPGSNTPAASAPAAASYCNTQVIACGWRASPVFVAPSGSCQMVMLWYVGIVGHAFLYRDRARTGLAIPIGKLCRRARVGPWRQVHGVGHCAAS